MCSNYFTDFAPALIKASAAAQALLAVSIMSSTIKQSFPSTEPIMFITSGSKRLFLLLSIIAKGVFNPSAIFLALVTPPWSGDTVTKSFVLKWESWRKVATYKGAVANSSTKQEKNPWICGACKSTVTTLVTPLTFNKSATNLADIGWRGLAFLSWRAYPK